MYAIRSYYDRDVEAEAARHLRPGFESGEFLGGARELDVAARAEAAVVADDLGQAIPDPPRAEGNRQFLGAAPLLTDAAVVLAARLSYNFV